MAMMSLNEIARRVVADNPNSVSDSVRAIRKTLDEEGIGWPSLEDILLAVRAAQTARVLVINETGLQWRARSSYHYRQYITDDQTYLMHETKSRKFDVVYIGGLSPVTLAKDVRPRTGMHICEIHRARDGEG